MSDIITQFKALKLYGMVEYYADLQNNGTPGATTYLDSSTGLLQAELTERSIALSAIKQMPPDSLCSVTYRALISVNPKWMNN